MSTNTVVDGKDDALVESGGRMHGDKESRGRIESVISIVILCVESRLNRLSSRDDQIAKLLKLMSVKHCVSF